MNDASKNNLGRSPSHVSTGNIQHLHPVSKKPLVGQGNRLVDEDGNSILLENGVWKFVTESNYTDSFGFQWNKFQKTQLDRFQDGLKQSSERFFSVTQWDRQDLAGQKVLEVGSGAGRFSRVVLEQTNATLYSVDYSDAVNANYNNNGPNGRLHIYQASIYQLPFAPGQFDKVFCFGVLQHTPDVKKSVRALAEMVAPGGELIVDFYPVRGWFTKLHAKYIFRPFTRRMAAYSLLGKIEKHAEFLIKAYRFFEKMGVGRLVNRFLPVCDIKTTLPEGLEEATLREWVILDTFDMFSPSYDTPQRIDNVKEWFLEFGLTAVEGSTLAYGTHNKVTFVRGRK